MVNLEKLFEDIKRTKAGIKRSEVKLNLLKVEVNKKLGKFGLSYRDL